ncbi:thiamine pyrophosphate-requiring protein [Rhodococcus sp. IEGM 1379]|uniref:thiamine pyrophosphate-requiring protein n=1 Tax=Rhodococcus sp. IEGM 1379 TaxID=3047086 RepID=UPI0024B723E0|nr:thiamine pyrophosphate-requiring protein [Rhodococcus sp. IEGM 1379]MDI9914215.1 thiamine pyrophosphate-requiring protein [Rhodococcus sp. IEGM 1379]
MKFGEAVARILEAEGIEIVCGYPLNYVFEYAADADIRPVITRAERTGGHIADAISRVTSGRKIGVYATQHGPGIENGLGAVAQAYGESVPLLVLPMGYRRDEAHLAPNFNSTISLRSISKSVEPINDPNQVVPVFRRAFSRLKNGRGGPVVVEIPRDLWFEDVTVPFEYQPVVRTRSGPDPVAVRCAAEILVAAERPVIYAGQGVHYGQAWPQLQRLAEMLAIPVTTSQEGKSAFPENHPLSLGTGGRAMPRTVHHFLENADVILGIGCSFTPTDFGVAIPKGKRVIHATLDPAHLDNGVVAEIGLVGDAALTLDALLEAVTELTDGTIRDSEAVVSEIREVYDAWLAEWMPLLTSDEDPVSAYRVVWELIQATNPADTIITHDAGSPRDQLSPFWKSVEPLSYLGWGKTTQLGYGLGLVMGAKLVHPEKLCINVWGDAAIGFTGLELETCVREQIPILSILLNNSYMAMETNAMGLSQKKFGTMNISGDYTAMARSLGVYAERIDDPSEIADALKRGIAQTEAGRPVLLEFITSRELRISTHGGDTYMSPVPDNFR